VNFLIILFTHAGAQQVTIVKGHGIFLVLEVPEFWRRTFVSATWKGP
jgi:hypothetical protein